MLAILLDSSIPKIAEYAYRFNLTFDLKLDDHMTNHLSMLISLDLIC